jgi:hypothetical protein
MRVSSVSGTAAPSPSSPADPAQARVLAELRARDRQVRAHEAAHLAAAGGLARSGATYAFEQGPDGRAYATGGEVSIDTSAVSGDPRATLAKARQIQAAALAPADPSPQDRSVAAAAAAMAAQAEQDLARGGEAGAGLLLDLLA